MEVGFVKRLGAFLIDIILVGCLVSLVLGFFPPNNDNVVLEEQLNNIAEKSLEKDIDMNIIMHQYGEVTYEIEYNNLLRTIINFVMVIGYFVLFQFKNNGQTLGKSLLKIRVVKQDGNKVELNDILFRSLLINGIIYSMLSMALIFILKGYNYFVFSTVLGFIQIILLIISMFMVIYRKDKKGLHDLIGKTKVITEKV
ncbi:MAG: RDD family protein [Bacilli bacterium]